MWHLQHIQLSRDRCPPVHSITYPFMIPLSVIKLRKQNVFPFMPNVGFQLANGSMSSLSRFALHNHQTFSMGGRSGLQVGPLHFTHWPWSHTVVIITYRAQLSIILLEQAGVSLKKTKSERQDMLFQIANKPSCINYRCASGPCREQVAQPQNMTDAGFWTCSW